MTKRKSCISASMMCTNPFFMNETFHALDQGGVEYLHLDIMDGIFVPNLGLSLDWIKALREHTDISCGYHLMTINPDNIFPLLNMRAGDIVSIHYESTPQILRTLENAKKYGVKVFLAINPGTPVGSLEELVYFIDGINLLMVNPGFAGQSMVPFGIRKARKLQEFLQERGIELDIEVDGNITFDHAAQLKACGANIFVAGTSSLFSSTGIREHSMEQLRAAIA